MRRVIEDWAAAIESDNSKFGISENNKYKKPFFFFFSLFTSLFSSYRNNSVERLNH